MRTVVVQVESCEVALLVGYRAGTGTETERLVARAASAPRSQAFAALRDLLAAEAMAPLTLSVDGAPLAPTAVRAKLALEGDGARPGVVLLVTFSLPRGASLSLATREPRTTRISWADRASGRVSLERAPAQGRWFAGVASFLLELTPPTGGPPCVRRRTPAAATTATTAAPRR